MKTETELKYVIKMNTGIIKPDTFSKFLTQIYPNQAGSL